MKMDEPLSRTTGVAFSGMMKNSRHNKFHNDRLVLDQVTPETEPLSFYKALWDKCQSEHIYMMDSTNKIIFPREILG